MKVKTLAVAVLALWAITSQADDEQFPVLRANGQVYSNATVFRVTATDIFFYSAQGAGNLKIRDLDPALQEHFLTGAPINSVAGQKSAATNARPSRKVVAAEKEQINEIKERIFTIARSRGVLVIAGILFLIYLFSCYCFKRICEKCSIEPGILVWIPVFNMIRLLQAGGLSGWLFLLFFIPLANAVMTIVMWIKICQACGKSAWLVLMLFVPVINLLFVPYLAFSNSNEVEVPEDSSSQSKSDKFVLR